MKRLLLIFGTLCCAACAENLPQDPQQHVITLRAVDWPDTVFYTGNQTDLTLRVQAVDQQGRVIRGFDSFGNYNSNNLDVYKWTVSDTSVLGFQNRGNGNSSGMCDSGGQQYGCVFLSINRLGTATVTVGLDRASFSAAPIQRRIASVSRIATITLTVSGGSVRVGQSTSINAMYRDREGRQTFASSSGSAEWTSSNPSVLTVSSGSNSGTTVTGVAAGTAIVTLRIEGVSGSIQVNVTS